MTVAELIAQMTLLPQDAPVVLPCMHERADPFAVADMYGVREVRLRITRQRGGPREGRPRYDYEIEEDGEVLGVLLE